MHLHRGFAAAQFGIETDVSSAPQSPDSQVSVSALHACMGKQSALPHAQAAELGEEPSDTAQVGILRHWFLLK